MTTPLSKMVALLIPSPLTPKRGLGSAGSLSEAKKGVAKVCGDCLSSVGDYSRQRTPSLLIRGRLESPKDLQGLSKLTWRPRGGGRQANLHSIDVKGRVNSLGLECF